MEATRGRLSLLNHGVDGSTSPTWNVRITLMDSASFTLELANESLAGRLMCSCLRAGVAAKH